jgi:hypothetical protein
MAWNTSGAWNGQGTQGGEPPVDPPEENTAPVSNAGPNQSNIIAGASVTLNGAGSSDADSDQLTYLWNQPAGITLSSTTVPNPTFTAPTTNESQTLIFSLVVNDGTENSIADAVNIGVLAKASSEPEDPLPDNSDPLSATLTLISRYTLGYGIDSGPSNLVIKGKDNPVILKFTFSDEFADLGLTNFSDLQLIISTETYSIVSTPYQLFLNGYNELRLKIGDITALNIGAYTVEIIGYSEAYNDGYLLTGAQKPVISLITIK